MLFLQRVAGGHRAVLIPFIPLPTSVLIHPFMVASWLYALNAYSPNFRAIQPYDPAATAGVDASVQDNETHANNISLLFGLLLRVRAAYPRST
ncbi:hypothetical protein EVAR_2929_1 [Eumeta japonica]|uniref:Uncharacterized protein n=1 Tax=Eumeta variegata TaxID=151549 RepID=A0A4C1T3W3_EUMVA|nr:hypothetical protein EVAR_2929_1 [Eumeta japonica]